MRFLREQVFATPTWLVPEDLLRRIEPTGAVNRVRQAQASAIGQVLNTGRLLRLAEQAAYRPGEAYQIADLLGDLRGGIWGELSGGGSIDAWRRTLQREHLVRLAALMTDPATPPTTPAAAQALAEVVSSDIRAMVRADLTALQGQIRARQARGGDATTRAHLAEVQVRIAAMLEAGNR